MEEVPSIWVDRAGAKAAVTQNFTRQSKATASVIVEEVTTRDESGAVVARVPSRARRASSPRTGRPPRTAATAPTGSCSSRAVSPAIPPTS